MSTLALYALIFLTTGCSALMIFLGARVMLTIKRPQRIVLSILVLFLYSALLWFQPDNWFLSDVAVLAVAITIGSLVGISIASRPSRSALVVFLVTVALVDVISFSGGLTAKIIADYREGSSVLLQFLSVSIPLNLRVMPVVGLGDLVIMGCIYVVLIRLAYPLWESFFAPLFGLLLALIVGLIIGGVYALPFVAGAVIGYVFLRPHRADDRQPDMEWCST